MTDKPIISVVTVCYNSADNIERCIRSVLDTLDDRMEYVIVDGASGDDTVKIAHRLCDGEARVSIYSEPDKGVYDAMNKAMKLARGEYVIYMNSDDQFNSGTPLVTMADYLTKHPECDCLYGQAYLLYENEDTPTHMFYTNPNPSGKAMYLDMICCHQAILCRRQKMIDVGGFDLSYKISADWDLLAKLSMNGAQYRYIDVIVAIFQMGGLSTKGKNAYYLLKEAHMVRKKYHGYRFMDKRYIQGCAHLFWLSVCHPGKLLKALSHK